MIHYITSNGVGNAWVGNELMQLSKQGIPFVLHSLHKPDARYFKSQAVADINQQTEFIYPLSFLETVGAICIGPFIFGRYFWFALINACFGRKESFEVRLKSIWHFVVACVWASKVREQAVSHIHSQWVNSCGTVAMYGAWLLHRPFSFTGHAADLFRERCALKDKITRAEFIVCISRFHRDFYIEEGADPAKLITAYCGIDTSLFKPTTEPRSQGPIRIISAARLVEKKGLSYLIDACTQVANQGDFFCTIAGDGPLLSKLQDQINNTGLADFITLTGKPLLQEDIPKFMAAGDIYCLPCIWAEDGDVDGLPQMLMEAMACGVPVISTDLVGISDLVEDGRTGLLVAPNNADQLAQAIIKLAEDSELRQQLASRGRTMVVEQFDINDCLEPLFNKFKQVAGKGLAQ